MTTTKLARVHPALLDFPLCLYCVVIIWMSRGPLVSSVGEVTTFHSLDHSTHESSLLIMSLEILIAHVEGGDQLSKGLEGQAKEANVVFREFLP